MFAAVLLWAARSSLQSCIENKTLPDHAVCNVTQACIFSAPGVEQCMQHHGMALPRRTTSKANSISLQQMLLLVGSLLCCIKVKAACVHC